MYHVCSLRTDGVTVVCWGDMVTYYGAGQPKLPTNQGSIVTLMSGDSAACVIFSSGTAECWGDWLYHAQAVSIVFPSATPSATVSSTGTASPTTSSTVTASNTITQTASMSTTPSSSMTDTTSPTPSCTTTATSTVSASTTQTASPTATLTETATASSSPSETMTVSPTQSNSGTALTSVTATPAATDSVTATQTSTLSSSGTNSGPATTSRSASPTVSDSPTSTVSVTFTSTPTPTPTPTVDAHSLVLVPVNAGISETDPLTLVVVASDSLPPLVVRPMYMPCSPIFAGGTISCHISGLGVNILNAPQSLPTCNGDTVISLLPVFGSPLSLESLDCIVAVGSQKVAATLPIQVQPTKWPLFQDLIVELQEGLIKSPWGQTINVTQAMMDKEYKTANVGNIDEFVLQRFGNTLPTQTLLTSQQSGSLALLTGRVTMYLVADSTFWDAGQASINPINTFDNETVITIGGVDCNVTWISSDGAVIKISTPDASQLCTDYEGDCGYMVLSVTNPAKTESSLNTLRGVTISCPPMCPGLSVAGHAVVPFATDNGSIVPAVFESGAMPQPISVSSSIGVYYTASCVGDGYVDPATGACLNVSDPAFSRCAFGAGSSCKLCPTGALCPGGKRAWPQPGYWTASESSGVIQACDAPAAVRCLGWSPVQASSVCGTGYRQGSFSCQACDSGFFTDLGGACSPCPSGAGVWPILQPILVFVACLLLVALALYAVVRLAAHFAGGTLAGGMIRMLQFVTWTITVVQVISQIGEAATPGLPPFAKSLYSAVNIFQFDGVALPASCTSIYPFTSQCIEMALVLAGVICLVALHSQRGNCMPLMRGARAEVQLEPVKANRDSSTRRVRLFATRACYTILLLLYPTVCNAVFGLLNCSSVNLTVRGYLSLNQDGRTVSDAKSLSLSSTVDVSVLVSNSFFVCYEADHAPAVYVAWVTLFVYVIGYPLGSLLYVQRRVNRLLQRDENAVKAIRLSQASSSSGELNQRVSILVDIRRRMSGSPFVDEAKLVTTNVSLAPFTAGDYRASVHWFRQLDMLLVLALAAILVFWSRPASLASLVGKCIVTCLCVSAILLLLWVARPYPAGAHWKLHVRSYAMCLTLLAAVTNCVTGISDLSSTGTEPSLRGTITGLAAILTAGCLGLAITLLVSFGRDMVIGARKERLQQEEAKAREAALQEQAIAAKIQQGIEAAIAQLETPSATPASPAVQLEDSSATHSQAPPVMRSSPSRRIISVVDVDNTKATFGQMQIANSSASARAARSSTMKFAFQASGVSTRTGLVSAANSTSAISTSNSGTVTSNSRHAGIRTVRAGAVVAAKASRSHVRNTFVPASLTTTGDSPTVDGGWTCNPMTVARGEDLAEDYDAAHAADNLPGTDSTSVVYTGTISAASLPSIRVAKSSHRSRITSSSNAVSDLSVGATIPVSTGSNCTEPTSVVVGASVASNVLVGTAQAV